MMNQYDHTNKKLAVNNLNVEQGNIQDVYNE